MGDSNLLIAHAYSWHLSITDTMYTYVNAEILRCLLISRSSFCTRAHWLNVLQQDERLLEDRRGPEVETARR